MMEFMDLSFIPTKLKTINNINKWLSATMLKQGLHSVLFLIRKLIPNIFQG